MLHLLLITLAFLAVMLFIFFKKRRKKTQQQKILPHNQNVIDNLESTKNNHKQLMHIAKKLDLKLKMEKIYTNPDLSIQDLAAEIGTNRSYISSTINTFYNQNFCSYINQYRFQELADTIANQKDYSHKELATKCGFGSIDSMKRTVKLNTGLSLREWKDFLTNEGDANLSDN